jgi:hypothetical protein
MDKYIDAISMMQIGCIVGALQYPAQLLLFASVTFLGRGRVYLLAATNLVVTIIFCFIGARYGGTETAGAILLAKLVAILFSAILILRVFRGDLRSVD